MKLFCIVVISILAFAAHPIEKISVGELTCTKGECILRVRLIEEDLQPILRRNGLDPEVSFRDYMAKPFDTKILPSIETYVKASLQVYLNNQVLLSSLKKVDWVAKTKYGDHAAIEVEMRFLNGKTAQIKQIKVKNSLLMTVANGQTNILHVNVQGAAAVLRFELGKETQEVEL